MSDPRFLQTDIEKQLSHLIEECGEVLAAAGKTQRWGWTSSNPLLPTEQREKNVVWLYREMGDLQEALTRLKASMEKAFSVTLAIPKDRT